MGLKKFKPALADCQQAASLQADAPSVKTLTRLARCQLSTGSTAPALSTLRTVLELEPRNAPALQLQKKVLELEAHLRNFDGAKGRGDWGMARLALEKCMQSMDAEGGDIPLQWRLWRVELEIARGQWDTASLSAKYVHYLRCPKSCLSFVAMRIGSTQTLRMYSLFVVCSCSLRRKRRKHCIMRKPLSV